MQRIKHQKAQRVEPLLTLRCTHWGISRSTQYGQSPRGFRESKIISLPYNRKTRTYCFNHLFFFTHNPCRTFCSSYCDGSIHDYRIVFDGSTTIMKNNCMKNMWRNNGEQNNRKKFIKKIHFNSFATGIGRTFFSVFCSAYLYIIRYYGVYGEPPARRRLRADA